jgi:lysyl-tRNA synthetase, class II
MADPTDNSGSGRPGSDARKGSDAHEAYDAGENRLVGERRAKLAQLRETGPAFPNDFKRDAIAGELLAGYGHHDDATLAAEAVRVRVAGRMMARRVMGKNTFAKLQDRSGQIQLFVQRDVLGQEAYSAFKRWDVGDIVAASGTLIKTKTGELSVAVDELRLLTKSLRPMPEKWHGISDQELKLRRRYVDLLVNERTRDVFKRRSQLVSFVRRFLDALDFAEVETPMMHPIPGGAAAKPFETYHHALEKKLYLRIAPELYLKRLLVGGLERVYELNRVFRNEGLSTRHNPEFTILEVYQAYARYDDIMALTENLVRESARSILGTTEVTYQGEAFDLTDPFPRRALEQTLIEDAGVPASGIRDAAVLGKLLEAHGVEVDTHWGVGKQQLELFEKRVEPNLRGPVFVTLYPTEVSPLARCNDTDPHVTDRFELFLAGRELANGFSELNDPEDQAARFKAQLEAHERGDVEAMVFDADYIEALEHGMPPAGGLGVGIDRLVMFLTDSPSIRDVLLFPQLR